MRVSLPATAPLPGVWVGAPPALPGVTAAIPIWLVTLRAGRGCPRLWAMPYLSHKPGRGCARGRGKGGNRATGTARSPWAAGWV